MQNRSRSRESSMNQNLMQCAVRILNSVTRLQRMLTPSLGQIAILSANVEFFNVGQKEKERDEGSPKCKLKPVIPELLGSWGRKIFGS